MKNTSGRTSILRQPHAQCLTKDALPDKKIIMSLQLLLVFRKWIKIILKNKICCTYFIPK